MALLVTAIISSVAAAAFFVSVSDLKISLNRAESAKSLRDAERVLAEAEMNMELCLKGETLSGCVQDTENSVTGVTNAVFIPPDGFSLSVRGEAGTFSAEIDAEYSFKGGAITLDLWRRGVEDVK